MIVATAATLFIHSIPLVSGEQAALAIQPFAGNLAGTLFAIGILNAGFMGLVIVSLSTAYAFAEFFGLSGSLNDSYQKSKTFLYPVCFPIDRGNRSGPFYSTFLVQGGSFYADHKRGGSSAGVLLLDQIDQ